MVILLLLLLPSVDALSSMNTEFSRRHLLAGTTGGMIAFWSNVAFALSTTTTNTATTSSSSPSSSVLSRDQVAAMLHSIPTFTIVDAEGVPYMVVGEDAKVTGYFFIDYTEAQRVLELAKTSADIAIREEKAEATVEKNTSRMQQAATLTNPWNDARITVVPLDTAVSLALRTDKARNHFQVAASATDIQDAMDATGQEDLAEGKVPLFYYSDFEISVSSTSDHPRAVIAPVYFSKTQLESEYRQRVPNTKSLPDLQTTELFAVLTAMLTSEDPDLAKVRVMAPKDSWKFERLCQKQNQPSFLLGKRNIVL